MIKEKWIIGFTLPSGKKYAASGVEGNFAMVPVDSTGEFKKAFAWDSETEAKKWFKGFIEQLDKESLDKLMKLKPWPMRCQILNKSLLANPSAQTH